MNATKLFLVTALLAAPLSAFADDPQSPSDSEQVAKIAQLPQERCQKDLKKLHDIYGQLRNMTSDERQTFLKAIVDNIRSQGLQIPPPPKPCSSVHLALESRCGNLSDAESKCQQQSSSTGTGSTVSESSL